MRGAVRTEIVRVANLAVSERESMERLYRAYYEGAGEDAFARDLAGKDIAILLKDGDVVCGFSTLVVYPQEDMRVLFSGDTVVDRANRNQAGLAGAFGHVMAHLDVADAAPLYWFLICKGARTYRFLPTFFRRFTPGRIECPDLQARLRRVAAARFPGVYDPKTGLLRFGAGKDRLRGDILRMDAESVRFRTLNPGWAKGDELCCLAPLAMDNLNRLGVRVIETTRPMWRL